MKVQQQTIAAGFSHSCAVGVDGKLYVWGDNKNQQLTLTEKVEEVKGEEEKSAAKIDSKKSSLTARKMIDQELLIVEKPTEVQLSFSGTNYNAKSVSCGPNFTMCIGYSNQINSMGVLDEEELLIQRVLAEYITTEGTLGGLFGLIPKAQISELQKAIQKTELKLPYQNEETDQNDKGETHSLKDEFLRMEEIEMLKVKKSDLISVIEKLIKKKNLFVNNRKILNFADKLMKKGSKIKEKIKLSKVEELSLGFCSDEVKLFAFGLGPKAVFGFQSESKVEDDDESEMSVISGQNQSQLHMQEYRKVQKKFQNEVIIVTRPNVIKFPRLTRPIISIACGSGHILAISNNFSLYSWGCGANAALGFGSKFDVPNPQLLRIIEDGSPQDIIAISCGKYHSMCITQKRQIYSWGTGQGGRLGHNDENEQLSPKMIEGIFRGKVTQISCGETHSACVTDHFCLYTWGNGQYGRLGHGFDSNEKKPMLVQDLEEFQITQVSCGAFHTLAVCSQGFMFSFGQGKYGKLGVNRQEREGVFLVPQKTMVYRIGQDQMAILDKNDVLSVYASYNHSIALTKTGRVLTWGYNGKCILGRARKIEEHLPIESGFTQGQLIAKVPKNSDNGAPTKGAMNDQSKQSEKTISYEIQQVACGSLNTVALTNAGEVYVIGSNTYGQLCREQDKNQQTQSKSRKGQLNSPSMGIYKSDEDVEKCISLINIGGEAKKRVQFIACGGEHIFTITKNNEVYSWGRNEKGQLGIGQITTYISEPQLIKDLVIKNITYVACGDDYSAALSIFGEVLVTGSMENGKLGVGQSWKDGLLLNFTKVPNVSGIKYVACGPNHMVAISEFSINNDAGGGSQNQEKRDGSSYAWGQNHRGQLGIGNREDQCEPAKIQNAKERFKKVVCGQNFTLALSVTNHVYFWGNYKYCCEKIYRDIEEPQIFQDLKGKNIKDIACSKYQCIVLTMQGEMRRWGKYMKEKMKDKFKEGVQQKPQGQADFKSVNIFPNASRFDIFMDKISTGPNHSAGVSLKNQLYTWGYKHGFKLGLLDDDAKLAKNIPVIVSLLMNKLTANKFIIMNAQPIENEQKFKDPQKDQQIQGNTSATKGNNMDKTLLNASIKEEKKKAATNQALLEEKKINQSSVTKKDDPVLSMIVEEQQMFEEEMMPKQLNLVSLAPVGDKKDIDQKPAQFHARLQQVIKNEKNEQCDEDSIIELDEQVLTDIDKQLKFMRDNLIIERDRKDCYVKLQSAFLQRVDEKPFKLFEAPESSESKSKDKKQEVELVAQQVNPLHLNKKRIKHILTALHVHPCYLINIYKQKILSDIEFVRTVKQIYSMPKQKSIYLCMSLLDQLIPLEFQSLQSADQLNFTDQHSIIGLLFKFIIKNQETNMDTLCSIGCHIVNKMIAKFSASSQAGGGGMDASFDVLDALSKNKKQSEAEKNKGNPQVKRAEDLLQFLEEIVKDMVEDNVLYPFNPYFVPKKSLIDEQTQKLIRLGHQDAQIKLESFRFSPEIAYIMSRLYQQLKVISDDDKISIKLDEEAINLNLLGLLFSILKDMIWKDYQIYIYPYSKSAKGLNLIDDMIKKFQYNNIENVINMLDWFFKGQDPFPEATGEQWNKVLLTGLNHLRSGTISPLFQNITRKNKMKTLSIKNYENLVLHSLESEGSQITMKKQTLGKLLSVLKKNVNFSVIKPQNSDPLYKKLLENEKELNEAFIKTLEKSNPKAKLNFKLKSRLLMEDANPIASRCPHCQTILIQTYSPPDSSTIMDTYNPQDSQQLFSQYCSILRSIENVPPEVSIIDQIEKAYKDIKNRNDFQLADSILKFLNRIKEEVKIVYNKLETVAAGQVGETIKLGNQSLNPEMNKRAIMEAIYINIAEIAEAKINERRIRKHDLENIKMRINQILWKQINKQTNFIRDQEIKTYLTTITNLQFGLANHELKPHFQNDLAMMKEIIVFTADQKMSQTLFKNLGAGQKAGLKSIIKKQAQQLIKNGTIIELTLPSLKNLIEKCELVFLEGEEQAINIKLVFRDKRFQMCGPPVVVSEAVLLDQLISQKELLDLRKQIGNSLTPQKWNLAGAIDFNQRKFIKILNEMDRSKTAYILNSAPPKIETIASDNRI